MRLRLRMIITLSVLATVGTAVSAKAGTLLLCPATANQNTTVGGVYTNVAGLAGDPCNIGTNPAIQMSIPTNSDYARLEWTGTGLTLGTVGLTNAVVALTSSAGDEPYYMMTFQDPADILGETNPGDQILMLQFQATPTVAGSSMPLDPNATLFNMYDNTSNVYLQGGQSNARTLDYWLSLYPTLSGDAVTGFRIGEGLAGGCGGTCSESLTIYSVSVGSPTPEPATFVLIGSALLGLGISARKLKAHKK